MEFLVTGHNSNIKIKDYPLDIKSIADKIENLSDRDKKIISTLIDKMLEIKQL